MKTKKMCATIERVAAASDKFLVFVTEASAEAIGREVALIAARRRMRALPPRRRPSAARRTNVDTEPTPWLHVRLHD